MYSGAAAGFQKAARDQALVSPATSAGIAGPFLILHVKEARCAITLRSRPCGGRRLQGLQVVGPRADALIVQVLLRGGPAGAVVQEEAHRLDVDGLHLKGARLGGASCVGLGWGVWGWGWGRILGWAGGWLLRLAELTQWRGDRALHRSTPRWGPAGHPPQAGASANRGSKPVPPGLPAAGGRPRTRAAPLASRRAPLQQQASGRLCHGASRLQTAPAKR